MKDAHLIDHSKIALCDARSTPWDDDFFHSIVTSPPYWGVRRYGDDPAEIGAGSIEQYLADMYSCAVEWRRICSGALWLNLADTWAGSGGAGGDYNHGGTKDGKPKWRQGKADRPAMSLMSVPSRVAAEFVRAGWILRHEIIWDKGVLRRESLAYCRRPGLSTERIYMFVKSRQYEFHADALPANQRGDIWRFAPSRGGNHLAPFPLELPMRCIPLTTNPGDRVLDPFIGSGTTMIAAAKLGRVGYGCDIYPWVAQIVGASA